MFRLILFFAAISSLAAVPARANLVNVTVNGSSASGSVSAACNPNDDIPGCLPGEVGARPIVTTPFSFSASDTQLGSFSQPWSASTMIGGSVQPFADENTLLCIATPSMGCSPAAADALYVELMGGHSGSLRHSMTQETETMTLNFELTAPARCGRIDQFRRRKCYKDFCF
jgi:hypothetical protein